MNVVGEWLWGADAALGLLHASSLLTFLFATLDVQCTELQPRLTYLSIYFCMTGHGVEVHLEVNMAHIQERNIGGRLEL